MKNFQQTPKQRRVDLANAKTALQNSRNKGFQPRPAWTSRQKLGGVFLETVVEKQYGAAHMGVAGFFYDGWPPFCARPRSHRR